MTPDPVRRFVETVRDMATRPDFLLPLVAAQRQFRESHYQMASASQLEDLFFDALGTYVAENLPDEPFRRRHGEEPWDYWFFGASFSHKESLSPGFTYNWSPGTRQPDGRWEPVQPTHDFEHPVVLIYAAQTSLRWQLPAPAGTGGRPARAGSFEPVGRAHIHRSQQRTDRGLVLVERDHPADTTVRLLRYWEPENWQTLGFHDVWRLIGGPHLLQRDLWVDRNAGRRTSLRGLMADDGPSLLPDSIVEVQVPDPPLPSGVYVLTTQALHQAPLQANNKAHYVTEQFARDVMAQAAIEGLFVPLPMWFTHFAGPGVPNLYSAQRRQFEAFAARTRYDG